MKTIFCLALLLVTSIGYSGTPPSGNILPELVEKVAPSVVNISSTRIVKRYVIQGMPEFFGMFGIPQEQSQKSSSLGTGFIIDSNGYILTNNHVIDQSTEVIVTLLDKRKIPAKIIGRDRLMDLALLQLKGGASNKDIKPVTLAESSKVRIGESVFAIGNPFGLSHTVTAGIISAKNRTIGLGPYDDFLQTDCSINFGNSGGPLFNLQGEVIGINTAINAQGQNLGFAIPIDEAKEQVASLKNHGYIVRAWLGALGQNITPAIQDYYNLPVDHGVVVVRTDSEGPAVKGGIKVGDIILAIDGIEISERGDIQRFLVKAKHTQTIKIKVLRQGKTLERNIKLQAAPDTSTLPDGVF